MAKQVINLGTDLNDGTGDALRVGAQKINSNFTELYNLLIGETGAVSIVTSVAAGAGLIVSSPSGQITISSRIASAENLGIVRVGTGLSIDADGVLSSPIYALPKAATNILGGIKVGDNLEIDNDGVLSAVPQNYTLPTATAQTLGGIKIGSGLTIEGGVVSVVSPGPVSALVSGPVVLTLDDNGANGELSSSGKLTVITKGSGKGIRLTNQIDEEDTNPVNYLEVTSTGTTIQSVDNSGSVTGSWIFSTNGSVTASVLSLNSDSTASISVDEYTWDFLDSGNLSIPGQIEFPDGSVQTTAYLGDAISEIELPRLVNGNFSVNLDTSGNLLIPGTIASSTGLALQSTTDTSIVAGTDLKLFSNGLFALRNYSTVDGIAIITNFNNLNQKSWLFNTTGSITLPTATVPATAKGAVGDQKGMFIVDDDYIYYCIETYTDGVADIWNRTAQTPWSN
jgi:hypothetical protein